MESSKSGATTAIDKPELLRRWANLGASLFTIRPKVVPTSVHPHGVLTWEPILRMIKATRENLKGEAKRLRAVLQESRERLHPLEDPFDVELGLHRWLAEEREEAYSDWLQWVLEQVKKPRLVFRILGIPPPSDISGWESVAPEIERECFVPFGHAGREGKLDVLIRYGDHALIAIEVKKGDAEEADTAKQEGYYRSLKLRPIPEERKHRVLLAASADEDSYHRFRFVSWAKVCIQLRRISGILCQENRVMIAAMLLAFVGAVEQNLLGFSAGMVRSVSEGGRAPVFNAVVVDHLASSLKREE